MSISGAGAGAGSLVAGAGDLREIVVLQNPPGVPDSSGGFSGAWADVARTRAKIVALAGDENANAQIEQSITRFRVTLRRREISAGQRLLWGSWALNIRAILPDPKRVFVFLLCEGVPA